MSAKDRRLEAMERELEEALEDMDEALDSANGNCANKIRGRTIRVRRSLQKLADEEEK